MKSQHRLLNLAITVLVFLTLTVGGVNRALAMSEIDNCHESVTVSSMQDASHSAQPCNDDSQHDSERCVQSGCCMPYAAIPYLSFPSVSAHALFNPLEPLNQPEPSLASRKRPPKSLQIR